MMRDIDYSEKDRAWLWLNSALNMSASAADKLVYLNDGLLSLYDSVKHDRFVRYPDGLTPAQRNALYEKASDAYIDGVIDEMNAKNIYAITRDSGEYPELLREIYDPPTVLFVKGSMKGCIKLPIAVIGSRKCSDYGREMAEYFGRELASHGACVVSGLAVGCDSEAARGALSVKAAELPTVAVLGCGVDIKYPASSAKLYDEIAERGALISESRPGRMPQRESFPQRNRIISGLSKGVLVIEAGAKSGTRITTDFAHEQGRDVFAVPGRITDLMSVGTNGLIKSGAAKAVFGVDDILFEYGLFLTQESSPIHSVDDSKLSAAQSIICRVLLKGEKSIDEICESTGFDVSAVNTHLTEMELSGIIRKLPNGEYSL